MLINMSPLDGRYIDRLKDMAPMSENLLIIEKFNLVVSYTLFLCELTNRMTKKDIKNADHFVADQVKDQFEVSKLLSDIRTVEAKHGHEMYAIIKVAQDRLSTRFGPKIVSMVNFGLTSEDIVNVVYRKIINEHIHKVFFEQVNMLVRVMHDFKAPFTERRILGMTHGQPATPVNFSRVISDFESRLNEYLTEILTVRLKGKMGGATGGLLAHKILLQEFNLNWEKTMGDFIGVFGLQPIFVSAQNNPSDDLVRLFGLMVGINGVLLDIARDMWLYNMRGIVKMEKSINTVGSTAMPHKVNPIEFENAEGNLGMSTAIFQFMMEKLPTSRMQRDLSDSTVMRNFAVPFCHQHLAIDSLIQGFLLMRGNEAKMIQELDEHPEVQSEIEQAQMKLAGNADAADKVRYRWRK